MAREQLDRLTVLQDADAVDLNAKTYVAEDSEATNSAAVRSALTPDRIKAVTPADAINTDTATDIPILVGERAVPAAPVSSSFPEFSLSTIGQAVTSFFGITTAETSTAIAASSSVAPTQMPSTSSTQLKALSAVGQAITALEGVLPTRLPSSSNEEPSTEQPVIPTNPIEPPTDPVKPPIDPVGPPTAPADGDHDRGHGNDEDHDDDDNPGRGGDRHGGDKNDRDDKGHGNQSHDDNTNVGSGDHDQGKGNDGRDVGNDKADEQDHSGRTGGNGVGDPNDDDDAHKVVVSTSSDADYSALNGMNGSVGSSWVQQVEQPVVKSAGETGSSLSAEVSDTHGVTPPAATEDSGKAKAVAKTTSEDDVTAVLDAHVAAPETHAQTGFDHGNSNGHGY